MKSLVVALWITALSGTAFAQAPSISDLAVTSETALTQDQLRRLLQADHDLIMTQGNFPDTVIQGNFPDTLTQANFPNSIIEGNFPSAVTEANFPFTGVKSEASAFPEPEMAVAPAISDLVATEESAVSQAELTKLLEAGQRMTVTQGNFPDAILQGNFPNAVLEGNFPDVVTQGNFPFAEIGKAQTKFPEPGRARESQ